MTDFPRAHDDPSGEGAASRRGLLVASLTIGAALAGGDLFVRSAAAARAGPPFLDFARIYDFDAGFEEPLAWDEESPPVERLPPRVQELSGTTFSLEGYMQALEYEESGDLVTKFVLTPKPVGCCTGHVPFLQEQALVSMERGGTEMRPLGTCVVEGTFRVDPVIDDEGDVLVLFQMRAQRVRGGAFQPGRGRP